MSERFSFIIPTEKEHTHYTAIKDRKNNSYVVTFNFGSIKTSTTYLAETVNDKLITNCWVKI